MSTRTTGRIVGALFLSAFALYGGGSAFAGSAVGATLLLLNSAAVITLGALVFRVVRTRRPGTAGTYLAARTVEAVLLALAPLGTLTGRELVTGDHAASAYWLAMAALGVGSIALCRALLTSGLLLPRLLAGWGVIGYASLALGSALELAGHQVGLLLSAPGGLFEVAAGVFLLRNGFRTSDAQGRGDGEGPVQGELDRASTVRSGGRI